MIFLRCKLYQGLLALLPLFFVAGCLASERDDIVPVDHVSTLQCESFSVKEAPGDLGCMEQVFHDISVLEKSRVRCVAVEYYGSSTDHAKMTDSVLEALSDGGKRCEVMGLSKFESAGLWVQISFTKGRGFIILEYVPAIAPNADITGFFEQENDTAITEEMLATGTCFFVPLNNQDGARWNRSLVEEMNSYHYWRGKVDVEYLERILKSDESCIILVGQHNQYATGKWSRSGVCDGFEEICLYTKGEFSVGEHGRIRGTSFALAYLLATLTKVWERMPVGTEPKEVVDMALQCVYGFGENFTPTPGERLDIWCLREKLLEARAEANV